jgi:hypothetical protein
MLKPNAQELSPSLLVTGGGALGGNAASFGGMAADEPSKGVVKESFCSLTSDCGLVHCCKKWTTTCSSWLHLPSAAQQCISSYLPSFGMMLQNLFKQGYDNTVLDWCLLAVYVDKVLLCILQKAADPFAAGIGADNL